MRIPLVALIALAACGGTSPTVSQKPSEVPKADPNAQPLLRLGDASEPLGYELQMQIDASSHVFRGKVLIDINIKTPLHTLWLHQKDLIVSSARLVREGQETPLKIDRPEDTDFLALVAPSTLPQGPAQIQIQFKAHYGNVNGLFHQIEGSRWYAYTDFEPTDARSAFPCYDDPRFKVPWDISIETPSEDLAFANTPEVERVDLPSGHRRFRFATTPPLPSYLVAMAAGPFSTIEGRASKTPLRIIAPQGQAESGRFVLEATDVWLRWFENYLGEAMPYRKLDFIAVPHFGGAMENPGLVTFSSNILLTGPGATDHALRLAAGVTTHELAHLWFGDSLTPKYWNDLWLNEGFATWLSDKAVSAWKPARARDILDISDKSTAYAHDHGLTGRRVREPIEGPSDIAQAFDAITYRKGGAILTMLEAWVGEEKFKNAIRSYVSAHRHGSVAAEDWLTAAVASTGDRRIPGLLQSYLGQTGIPQIHTELSCSDGKAKLSVRQERYLPVHTRPSQTAADRKRIWKIPLCLRYDTASGEQRHCELVERTQHEFPLRGEGCPDWVMPNDRAAGYYHYDMSADEYRALQGAKLDPREEFDLATNIVAALRGGSLELGDALSLLEHHASKGSARVQRFLIPLLYELDSSVIGVDDKEAFAEMVRRWFGPRGKQLGHSVLLGENHQISLLRPPLLKVLADLGRDRELRASIRARVDAWLPSTTRVDLELLDAWLQIAAIEGDAALLEQYAGAIGRHKDLGTRMVLTGARFGFRDPTLFEGVLRKGVLQKNHPPNVIPILKRAMSIAPLRSTILGVFEEFREQLLADPPSASFARFSEVYGALCSEEGRAALRRFAGKTVDAEQTLSRIGGCMAFTSEQGTSARNVFAPK